MKAAPSVLLAVLLGGISAPAQDPPNANEPDAANGPELRELARSLARASADASAAARKASSGAGRELASLLDDLARDTRSLAARVERNASARELDNEVSAVARTAGRVEAALAGGRPGRAVTRPYQQASDALSRLRALVASTRRPSPAPESTAEPAASSDELTALARDVEERMTLTQQAADRFADSNPGYAVELVGDIDRLADEARDLRRDVESGRADPRSLRNAADRLLEGVRAADELMRSTETFRDAWGAWQDAIADLVRMAQLLRA